jgi:glycosyltransferase involved in cell wall biosynthesis
MMINVLHIDTELTWRGGENQILQLVLGSKDKVNHHIAVRPGSLAEQRFKDVCPVVLANMRGGFAPRAAWQLSKYCKDHNIEVIDAHSSNAHSIALLMKVVAPNLKLVVHRRVDFVPKRDPINRLKYHSKKIDSFVAISQAIKKVLVSYGIPQKHVAVIPSAIDLKKYETFIRNDEKRKLAETFNLDPSLMFLGNASAFTHQKGYDTLLKALKHVKDEGHKFHAFFAGDGELMKEMEDLRAKLNLEYDVTFLGFIEDVPRFLSALDILTISSRFEGLGTIVLEAIGAGLAVAATAAGGIPEMIIDHKTGLLSPVDDPEKLALSIIALLASQDLRTKLSSEALSHVRKDFSIENMIKRNIENYQTLLLKA